MCPLFAILVFKRLVSTLHRNILPTPNMLSVQIVQKPDVLLKRRILQGIVSGRAVKRIYVKCLVKVYVF